MTSCEYLDALDYLLKDLHKQMQTNFLAANTPNQHAYVLFLWNMQEINAVLWIAEKLGLRQRLELNNQSIMQDIFDCEEEFCEDIISKTPSQTAEIPIQDMFLPHNDICATLANCLQECKTNNDKNYEADAKKEILMKLISLWWKEYYYKGISEAITEIANDANQPE